MVEEPTALEYYFPVNGEITKKYSVDALMFSQTLNDYRVHSGIDISTEPGCSVHAYTDGIILDVYDDPMMGKTVSIIHEGDLVSYYMNLDSAIPEDIKKGAFVKAGDVIGVSGSTALVEIGDEPHVHFELKVGGVTINPEKELDDAIKK